MLTSFVLHRDRDSGRYVREPDRRLRFVNVLYGHISELVRTEYEHILDKKDMPALLLRENA